MRIGGFVSAAGGLDKAIERADSFGFEVAMFFIGSPQSWNLPTLNEEDADKVIKTQEGSNVKATYAHALYLANMASPDKDQYQKSVKALAKTMQNGELINLNGVIFHLGSHKNTSTSEGLKRVAKGMVEVLNASPGKTNIIMENAVQQGGKVGVSLEEIGEVLNQVPKEYKQRVKVCFDTCHGFAEGYDYKNSVSLQQLVDDLRNYVGLANLECFHVNDSQGELESHKDRHANYGEGFIGKNGFQALFNRPEFAGKDLIMEIPGVDGNGPSDKDLEILKKAIGLN
ncbi:deoxyribonuclease IV [candidate division WWE3 bacterium]|uniref:Probable endonuclease 4 n=1 Tax=candidate division WWE3 bacterium TaxID=2053526 RepID=A0A955RS02_UNCKA|nr:deoxyribonuclease IV [candidate division WWE3 bacterium]